MEDKTQIFIEKAKRVHCGENLDYSFVVYKNNRTPVKIIDHDLDENGNEYGEFWQTPYNHLKGQCHPRKRAKRISEGKRSKQEEIIERFKAVHKGENLDYSEVQYVNMHTKVKIISHDIRPDGTEYGEFWQEPSVHLKGCTHPDIGKVKQSKAQSYTTDEFIKRAKIVHQKDDYSYDFVDYKNSKTKVKIFCNKIGGNGKPHGLFETSPDLFLMGKGCPMCGYHASFAEDELIEYVSTLVGSNNVVRRDKSVLNGKELDIYIPSLNFAIEYNGLRWHSEKFGKDKKYHLQKTEECKKHGIRLVQIFEDEYVEHKEIVLSKISHLLGCHKDYYRIMARKCDIGEISGDFAKEFLEMNHIQGFSNSTVHLGAFYKGSLIAVMSFKRENSKSNKKWELTRFATENTVICQGIGGKLFQYFVRTYNPEEVKSFADRRWTVNEDTNVYIKMGFKFAGYLKPEYRYYNEKVNPYKRFHKFGFRKDKLSKKYNLPISMTETEMTEELGYKKIFDCGLIKYVWVKEKGEGK